MPNFRKTEGVAGQYIKLGAGGWVKLDDIEKCDKVGNRLVIKRKGKPDLIYQGANLDHVEKQLKKHGK